MVVVGRGHCLSCFAVYSEVLLLFQKFLRVWKAWYIFWIGLVRTGSCTVCQRNCECWPKSNSAAALLKRTTFLQFPHQNKRIKCWKVLWHWVIQYTDAFALSDTVHWLWHWAIEYSHLYLSLGDAGQWPWHWATQCSDLGNGRCNTVTLIVLGGAVRWPWPSMMQCTDRGRGWCSTMTLILDDAVQWPWHWVTQYNALELYTRALKTLWCTSMCFWWQFSVWRASQHSSVCCILLLSMCDMTFS